MNQETTRIQLNVNGNNGAETAAEPRRESNENARTERRPDPWVGSSSLFGQKLTASNGSEGYNKIMAIIKDSLKEKDIGLDIVGFPTEQYPDLSFSVIVVVRNLKKLTPEYQQHTYVVYQPWILATTGELPRPFPVETNTRNPYLITPTVEDANNRVLMDLITRELKAKYKDGANEPVVYPIDPIVVYRTLDIDANDGENVRRLLVESQTAVETRAFQRHPQFVDYQFPKELGVAEMQLPVSVDFVTNEVHTNSLGQPVNIDAVVTTSVEKINNSRNAPIMNRPGASRVLCQAGVMIDLVPAEPEVLNNNRTGRSRNDPEPQAAWVPRLILTAIEQFRTRTTAGVFFGIASSAELGRSRNWAKSFRGRRGKTDAQNLRDIGYLNIEANLGLEKGAWGSPTDTDAADFDDRAFTSFLDATVARDVTIAVDCPTSGPSAYLTTPFYNLARGANDSKKRAAGEIIQALRDATGGLIDDEIDLHNVDILEGPGEMIHMGNWFDANGKIRDIRELDNYLAMAVRIGPNNPEELINYVKTYYNLDVNEDRRLADRLRLLESAASGAINVTGSALRVQVNPEVVDAFNRALAAGKVPLVSRDTGDSSFTTQRVVSRQTGRRYSGSGFGRGSSYRDERSRDGRRDFGDRY